jgi:anti-sigma28 factor (negative regulator of flagellin synthesis)
MNNIDPINTALPATNIPAAQESSRPPMANETQPQDRVEISKLAQTLNERGLDISDVRVDKVLVLREAIANDTYITQDKIDITVNRLLEVLRSAERA